VRPAVRTITLLFLLATIFASDALSMDRTLLRWMRKKPVIDSIVIKGNSYLSESDIRRKMYSRPRTLLRMLKGDRRTRVQRENYGRDTLEIKYAYLINGFLGVRVDEKFEMLLRDSTEVRRATDVEEDEFVPPALIRVTISEGNQFMLGEKTITGNYKGWLGGYFDKIIRRLEEGKPVNPFALRQAVFDIKTVLANKGYPYARVAYAIDTITSTPVAPVEFRVESDSLVYFGDITVEGSEHYPEYAARRELKIITGEVYSREAILESQERLFESGYFSFPQLIQNEDQANRLRPDFLLKVRERKPMYIDVKTGAGQSEVRDLIWDFSTGFGKRNLFGSRRVDLAAEYSFSVGQDSRLITHLYRLRYTEPWFLGIRMPIALTGEFEPPIRSVLQEFDISRWSISASTSKRFGREIKSTAGLEYVKVEISGVPAEAADSLRQSEGISVRRKLYSTFRRDSRDNIFIPRRGSLTDLSADYYGGFLGGDDSFFKLEGSWSRYQILWPGWISATRIKGGWVDSFGDSDAVPEEERLYLGGANTVRGFVENNLGPLRDDGSASGAKMTVVFNQEFRWKTLQIFRPLPLLGDFFETLPLWQSVFFDMGNGFRTRSEIKLSNFAYSYGTGFQIVSPAGPIRIDYARRIATDRFDFDSRWHFTILYAF